MSRPKLLGNRRPTPGNLKAPHIAAVNLIQPRVSRRALVTAVTDPLPGIANLLGPRELQSRDYADSDQRRG
jgi:hypothetical protein